MADNYGYGFHNKTDEFKKENRKNLLELFKNRSIPDDHLLVNMGLYTRSSALSKILFLDEMYKKILKIPGKIMVFGLWWGQDAIVFENLRAIHEPYNYSRQVVGFDTFTGYPDNQIGEKDKRSDIITEGGYAVADGYFDYINELAQCHENENVMYNIKKMSFVKGDVCDTVPNYFKENPESIVALSYFDLALYQPTKVCLEQVLKHSVKGSIVVFDELGASEYSGETQALRELLDMSTCRIEKSMILPDRTYLVVE